MPLTIVINSQPKRLLHLFFDVAMNYNFLLLFLIISCPVLHIECPFMQNISVMKSLPLVTLVCVWWYMLVPNNPSEGDLWRSSCHTWHSAILVIKWGKLNGWWKCPITSFLHPLSADFLMTMVIHLRISSKPFSVIDNGAYLQKVKSTSCIRSFLNGTSPE